MSRAELLVLLASRDLRAVLAGLEELALRDLRLDPRDVDRIHYFVADCVAKVREMEDDLRDR